MTNETLETLARLLGRAFMVAFVLACVWFAVFFVSTTTYCDMQMRLFGLTAHECALMTYAGIGLLKLVMWLVFFAPWLAIRLELRHRRGLNNA